jgi:hypothetical protein
MGDGFSTPPKSYAGPAAATLVGAALLLVTIVALSRLLAAACTPVYPW